MALHDCSCCSISPSTYASKLVLASAMCGIALNEWHLSLVREKTCVSGSHLAAQHAACCPTTITAASETYVVTSHMWSPGDCMQTFCQYDLWLPNTARPRNPKQIPSQKSIATLCRNSRQTCSLDPSACNDVSFIAIDIYMCTPLLVNHLVCV